MREFLRYILIPAMVGGGVGFAVMSVMDIDTTPRKAGYAEAGTSCSENGSGRRQCGER